MIRQLVMFLTIYAATASVSRADLLYSFRFSPTTTLVNPGLQSIDIFLDQTASSPDVANLHTIGLGTANFTISSSDSTISFTGSTGFVDGAGGGAVGSSLDVSTPGSAIFAQSSLLNPGTVASGTLASSGSSAFSTIRIGSISFNLAAGQSTTLSTTNFANGFDLADLSAISGITAANLTITAVPEPCSLVLVSLVGIGIARRYRRK